MRLFRHFSIDCLEKHIAILLSQAANTIQAHTLTRAHTHTHTHTHVRTPHTLTHTHTHTHTQVRTQHTLTHTHAYTHTYTHRSPAAWAPSWCWAHMTLIHLMKKTKLQRQISLLSPGQLPHPSRPLTRCEILLARAHVGT